MSGNRDICVTAVDGNTGFLIAELLLTDETFTSKISSVCGLTLNPAAQKCKELAADGCKIVHHKPGNMRGMVETLLQTGCDTMCLIPPAHEEKYDIVEELVYAAKRANIPNVCFIGSAGCDLAEKKRQPRLREFVDLETLVLSAKGDPSTRLAHSPCVIRAGFYAENLLVYAPQAQKEGILPIPIGKEHKFAPVALGDVAQVAAHVLSGYGENGFDDRHRGQLMVVTGPALVTGEELAAAAEESLKVRMKFEDISEAEAKRVLRSQSQSDKSELQYILEYYSLVREGKTNYISTTAYHDVTGSYPQEPDEFFSMYAEEFGPKQGRKRRKTENSR
jgi:hypothetical protein